MSDATISVVIGLVTFLVSVGGSMFISGARWGRVEQTLIDLQTDRVKQSDISALHHRLASIEGMFTLTLKPDTRKG